MSVNKSRLVKSIQDRGNYSTVPNELWTLSISVKAKTAYCYLLAQSDKWNPGLREIAEGISMSKNSAREALRELEAAGMIEVDEGPHGLRNMYSFTPISDWTAHPNSAPAIQNNTGGTHPNSGRPIQILDGGPSSHGTHPIRIQEEGREEIYFKEEDQKSKLSSLNPESTSFNPTSTPGKPSSPITPKFNGGAKKSQSLTPTACYDSNYEVDVIGLQKTYDHWGLTKENPWVEFDENGKPKKRSKV